MKQMKRLLLSLMLVLASMTMYAQTRYLSSGHMGFTGKLGISAQYMGGQGCRKGS